MKEHYQKAIDIGEAYDATAHPEITKKLYEENIGWMRDTFNDIDVVIDNAVERWSRKEVAYYEDVETSLSLFIARNIGKYIKLNVGKMRKELGLIN